jgi:glycosyltransferase involved in cell wall biosynthesis
MTSTKLERGLRVAIVTSYPPSLRGEANYAGCLVGALSSDDRIEAITVLTHYDDQTRGIGSLTQDANAKISVQRILGVGEPRRSLNGIRGAIWAIRNHPDILHVFGPQNPSLYGGAIGESLIPLLLATRLVGGATVITLHSVYRRADIDAKVAKRIPFKLVAWPIDRWIDIWMRLLFKLSKRVLVVTTGNLLPEDLQLSSEFGFDPRKLLPEPHASTLASVRARAPKDPVLTSLNRFVVCPGFFRREKGFELGLTAFALLKEEQVDWHLVVAGPIINQEGQDYLKELVRTSERLGIADRVHFLPRFFEDEEFRWLLESAGVVLLPYTMNQGTSGIAVEALSLGTTVVATAVGQTIVRFSSKKLLLANGEPASIADRLRLAMERYKRLRPCDKPDLPDRAPTFRDSARMIADMYMQVAPGGRT